MGATRTKRKSTNYAPDLAVLMRFAEAVVKNKPFSETVTTSRDPKHLFRIWQTAATHTYGDKIQCRVMYLPEGGEFIKSAQFFAMNNKEAIEWRSVDVLPIQDVSIEIPQERQYSGLRKMMGL